MDRVFLVIRDREHVLRGPAAQERRKEKRPLVIRMTKDKRQKTSRNNRITAQEIQRDALEKKAGVVSLRRAGSYYAGAGVRAICGHGYGSDDPQRGEYCTVP